jgi:hypothetical protein
MVRRLILPFAVVLALTAALAAAGCGEDGVASISAAEAADGTRAAESARVGFRMKLTGMGLPEAVTVTGRGVAATAAPRMDVTFDFGELVELIGATGDGRTRVLLDGRRVFVDPPAIPGLELPGGAKWATADLGRAFEAVGIDAGGLGELMRLTPEQQLDALAAAGSVKPVGQETIDGAETTHLRGSVKLSDFIEALPPDRRARVRKAIKDLERLPGGDAQSFDEPTPVDMWVDDEKRLRRMTQAAPLPAQKGVPAGRFEMTLDFTDYGTPLDIRAPQGGDVFDATKTIIDAVRSGAAAP